ncbi:MAG: threonine ammonia-lyase [Acidobacteriota bacterium]
MPDAAPTLESIRRAHIEIQKIALVTPVLLSHHLTRKLGSEVWIKAENLQRAGSFKIRGAYNKISSLSESERGAGVLTASAGNHAQGVALAASFFHMSALVVMPENTPQIKLSRTRAYGAEIIQHGSNLGEAYQHALELVKQTGRIFVPPYDDWKIIEGQATLGLEIIDQVPDVESVVVPVGGGGLISGIALAIRALKPSVKIYGVQAAGANPMVRSFREKRPVEVEYVDTIADGVKLTRVGELTFPVIQEHVDDMVDVSEEEISEAIVQLLEKTHLVSEGAGAVGLAALLGGRLPTLVGKVCIVVSGGNIDINFMARIIEQGLTKSGRYLTIRTRVRDIPGELFKVMDVLVDQRANVLDIIHHRAGWKIPVGWTEIEFLLETTSFEQHEDIVRRLREKSYWVETGG